MDIEAIVKEYVHKASVDKSKGIDPGLEYYIRSALMHFEGEQLRKQYAMSDLLPCPFCGGEPYIQKWIEWDTDGESQVTKSGGPMCSKCHISAPSKEVWNTRVK